MLTDDHPVSGHPGLPICCCGFVSPPAAAPTIRQQASPEDLHAQAPFITERARAMSREVREITRAREEEFFDFIEPEDPARFRCMPKRADLNMRKN